MIAEIVGMMAVPVSPTRRKAHAQRFVRHHPTPHVCPDLNLSHYIERGVLGWSEWRRLRGDGFRSWCRWLGSVLLLLSPSEQELKILKHHTMMEAGMCHRFLESEWCFCERDQS